MAPLTLSEPPQPLVQTSFLVPNLHCPACVNTITSLLEGFQPEPIIRTISTINHIVTVAHHFSISAASICQALTSAGYDVFDVILDPASTEDEVLHTTRYMSMEEAVQRWNPKRVRSGTNETARMIHNANCQMCAAHDDHKEGQAMLDSVVVTNPDNRAPDFMAILSIDGMTCSSCVGTVTKALQSIQTVSRTDVSLVGRSANVRFTSNDTDRITQNLVDAVEDAGYDAQLLELRPVENLKVGSSIAAPSDSWEATYSIRGMSCSSCVGKVSAAVRKLEFVERADINLIARSGTVSFTGKDNECLIREAIEQSGCDATIVALKARTTKEKGQATTRTVSLWIDGIHCLQCPKRILVAAQELLVEIRKAPSVEYPILTISYMPNGLDLTIRKIMDKIKALDPVFDVSIHKPVSVEERSREMLYREQRAILLRALLCGLAAIPSLVIGVVYMNLVSKHDRGYIYLMHPLHGVSRAEWANFITATPVYLFAADYFHRRTVKEIWTLWRPRSSVPVAKRFYRFGSMNMLISLGTTIAYFSSLAQMIVGAVRNSKDLSSSSRQSYFDSVVFLTMFLLVGRLAEADMKAKSGDATSALGKLRPTTASLVVSNDETNTPALEITDVDLIDIGDLIRIPNGSSPPCDGTLLDKSADFDESSLTGESRLVRKKQGEAIFSGTINKGSAITIKVTNPVGVSMLDTIIQVVREGQSKRAPVERVADLLTAYFVPVVTLIAILTWLVWLSLGLSGSLPDHYLDVDFGGWPFWSLQFAIAVFVIACPCGLGLAAPTAMFVGGGLAAKHGILVKGGGEAFQEASTLDAVIFDKTGTLTEGIEPAIVQHETFAGVYELNEVQIFSIIRTVEENSSHPLARAAVRFSNSVGNAEVRVVDTEEIAGRGLKATVEAANSEGQNVYDVLIGNEALLKDHSVSVAQDAVKTLIGWKTKGYSVILLACRIPGEEWRLGAMLAASDPLRLEAAEVVKTLQTCGVDVWMLSGDNPSTANAIGAQVGIPSDKIIAGVIPTQKAEKVKYLQRSLRPRRGKGCLSALTKKRNRATVAMVGDGINDAPALAAADVGIAMASGSDVAVQSAAFILVQSDLRAVLTLVSLSRAVFRRVIFNFCWAAIYNIVALPVAAGVLFPIQVHGRSHIRLDPAWAALAMALSSISVIASSLFLRTTVPGIGYRH